MAARAPMLALYLRPMRTHRAKQLAIILASLAAVSVHSEPASTFAIQQVSVFDGERTIERTTVVITDGRIVSVAPDAALPKGINIIDGRGKTLLPGLIDSHVHVFPGAQRDALRFGVTTELDMFDLSHDFKTWRAQRESLARTEQADTWAAGTGITVKGGAPVQDLPPSIEVPTLDSAADAKSYILARVAEGSDFIKIFIENLSEYPAAKPLPTLTRDEVCAVIEAAHGARKITTTHAQAEWAAKEAIECGTDGLAHIFPDTIADSEFIAMAKSHRVFVQTTDSVWAAVSGVPLAKEMAADARVKPFLSAAQSQSLLAEDEKTHPDFFTIALANTRLLHDAGIALLVGTDAPNAGTAHGVSLHQELQTLVKAGYTPQQALQAATSLPALKFHLGDRGRIVVGGRADLVLVNGDPTNDISATLSIERIWKNGYPVERAPPKD
jgi:imidazolonepropionase-like amidohydrolase